MTEEKIARYCMQCHLVYDDQSKAWMPEETYKQMYPTATYSHGVCESPVCNFLFALNASDGDDKTLEALLRDLKPNSTS
jgi:hypothetical protein